MSKLKNNEYLDFDDYLNDETKVSKEDKIIIELETLLIGKMIEIREKGQKIIKGIFMCKENKITVHLAEEYLGEHLISRSIARRILSNIEKFKVIFLDFNGVKTIGQAFADEIFRVFRNKHKEITILPINMNEEVKFMIKRVDKNIVME